MWLSLTNRATMIPVLIELSAIYQFAAAQTGGGTVVYYKPIPTQASGPSATLVVFEAIDTIKNKIAALGVNVG